RPQHRERVMKNCIVLGAGRSGTSTASGLLHGAGYYLGEQLYPGDVGNPRGYFEDAEVNDINEALLEPLTVPPIPGRLGRLLFPAQPTEGQRWLARLPLRVTTRATPALEARIIALTRKWPYCIKDPRLCYTLPSWMPLLGEVVLICMFRDPSDTVTSILKE